jgi:formate dehydrogenase maturation protein FdhE
MNRRILIIILVVVLVIVLIIAGVVWFGSLDQNEVIVQQDVVQDQNDLQNNTNTQENNDIVDEQVNKPIAPIYTEEDKQKAQLEKQVVAFTERYGSYSNQSDYENLEDLMKLMSRELKKWAENFISSKRSQNEDTSVYFGLTTKVLSTEIIDFDNDLGRARFEIEVQRREVVGSNVNARVYYKTANVGVIKESGVWKIDKINFE